MATTMTVAERITALQQIFHNFGIPVAPNSALDQAIRAEFGRGKRSKLNALLQQLNMPTDAAVLASCIGEALQKSSNDPHVISVATFMMQRLPALLQILDIQQQSQQREFLLGELLQHFVTKIPAVPQSERLLRMLTAAQQNLHKELQLQNAGVFIASAGNVINLEHMQRSGKILQGITPALLALEQTAMPIEQRVNHCVRALQILGCELHNTKLQKAATILEHVHGLAKVSLPALADHTNVEQALQKRGIAIGRVSLQQLQHRALKDGLTAAEIAQLLYAGAMPQLRQHDQDLLKGTYRNQQYAAICGYLAQLAQDVQIPKLEKIAIAGICLSALRQTYVELKTKNLNPANFSESLGLILSGAGAISNNHLLQQIGGAVLTGVSTYAGLVAVPGGAAAAIPLAVCSIVGKLVLEKTGKEADEPASDSNTVFCDLLTQIVQEQQQIRQEFVSIYQGIQELHQETLQALDQGFANLEQLTKDNQQQVLRAITITDYKLDLLQYSLNKEFSDLYLEYVRNPLEEIDFALKYGCNDIQILQQNKHKLSLWLLYKAKHKVNGLSLIVDQEANPDFPKYMREILSRINDADAVLAMVNRYVNLKLEQQLPEDLPHIPTWLQAAHAYVMLSSQDKPKCSLQEANLLRDIVAVGSKITAFVTTLAQASDLWQSFANALTAEYKTAQECWQDLQLNNDCSVLQDLTQQNMLAVAKQARFYAYSATSQQLEPFTPIQAEITPLWLQYLKEYIPAEFLAAQSFGLGELQIIFTVDQSVNTFADLHIGCGNYTLPDAARDVLFRVDVRFKHNTQAEPFLLSTSWFAYDLQTSQQRFDGYYMRKFQYPLKHRRYHWISLDGRRNQVEGYGDTNTHKLIDYDRLAMNYRDWLLQAQPINTQVVLHRVGANPKFRQHYSHLLNNAQATVTQDATIVLLHAQLQLEIRDHVLKQRISISDKLQQQQELSSALEKIATFYVVLAIYARLLNLPFVAPKIIEQFKELNIKLRQAETLDQDLLQQFNALFTMQPLVFSPQQEYLHGEFYAKIQAALTQLGLLRSNIIISKLCYTI